MSITRLSLSRPQAGVSCVDFLNEVAKAGGLATCQALGFVVKCQLISVSSCDCTPKLQFIPREACNSLLLKAMNTLLILLPLLSVLLLASA
ncbi:MAG: hypothetical protein KGK06_07060, partial [Xanthomonadaceae bacterium]|nr:hypothetical protein [Xanthomonadaceae bacterium]